LADAWLLVHKHAQAGEISEKQRVSMYGRLAMRSVLHMLKKTVQGREPNVVYTDLAAIKDKFMQELQVILHPSDPVTATNVVEAATDLISLADPVWVMSNKYDMTVGSIYVNREKHMAGRFYKLTAMTSEQLVFQQLVTFSAIPDPVTIPYATTEEKHLRKWVAYKGSVPTELDSQEVANQYMKMTIGLQIEISKCHAFASLAMLAIDNALEDDDLLYTSDFVVFAGKAFKKGDLKLIPATESKSKIADKSSDQSAKNAIEVKGGVRLYIQSPKLPAKFRSMQLLKADSLTIVPFWLVKEESEDGGNMEYQQLKVGEFSFTILTNSKAIKAHDKLIIAPAKLVPVLKRQKTLTK
jgi:hypothetical protein